MIEDNIINILTAVILGIIGIAFAIKFNSSIDFKEDEKISNTNK